MGCSVVFDISGDILAGPVHPVNVPPSTTASNVVAFGGCPGWPSFQWRISKGELRVISIYNNPTIRHIIYINIHTSAMIEVCTSSLRHTFASHSQFVQNLISVLSRTGGTVHKKYHLDHEGFFLL